MKLNEWKNTIDVIKWFENFDQKLLLTFTISGIKHFYPLLKNAIQFATEHTDVTKNDFESNVS